MASILGSCGCGCGGGCTLIASNCNFALRRFDMSIRPIVSWNEQATDNEKACFESDNLIGANGQFGGCYGINLRTTISFCTGEGIVIREQLVSSDPLDPLAPFELVETQIGTCTKTYLEENISWENIREEKLSNQEANSPCTFSYNFKLFTPGAEYVYVIISKPCQESMAANGKVELTSEGKGYFRSYYNETTKQCVVYPDEMLVFS